MEKITPDGDLKAIYEIGSSGANIQKLALEDRLDDTRNAFNASLSTRPTRPRPANHRGGELAMKLVRHRRGLV